MQRNSRSAVIRISLVAALVVFALYLVGGIVLGSLGMDIHWNWPR